MSARAARSIPAWAGVFVVTLALGACSGSGSSSKGESVTSKAAEVKSCLERSVQPGTWAELPVTSQGAPVFAVDFGTNSVQIYIEKNPIAVTTETASIRAAENSTGNVEAPRRVILHPQRNVLISWANEPGQDQAAVVQGCVGFS